MTRVLVSEAELEARAVIYRTPIEIDCANNIAVLSAADRVWYARLAPIDVTA